MEISEKKLGAALDGAVRAGIGGCRLSLLHMVLIERSRRSIARAAGDNVLANYHATRARAIYDAVKTINSIAVQQIEIATGATLH